MKISSGAARYKQKRGDDDDYIHPRNLYRLMPLDEQKRLVENIVRSLKYVP